MNEFIKRDGKIIVNVEQAEAYIPADMFIEEDKASAIATVYGEGFKILGIFNMRISNSENEEDLRKSPIKTFSFTNMINTFPSANVEENIQLTPDSEEIKYRVLKYSRGDIMMDDNLVQSGDNAVKFMNAIIRGKIPNTIPYEDIITSWMANFESNDQDPKIPNMFLQAIVSESCRYKKNLRIPFRKIYGKDMTNNDYVITNMRGTAANTSVFSSQVFEHMGRMITTSIDMTRRNADQVISPIEKVLYM